MKKIALLGFILALLILASGYGLIYYLYSPVSQSSEEQEFTIEKGQTLTQISANLEKQQLIKNQLALRLLVKYRQSGQKIQAGNFKLRANMNLDEILLAMQKSPEQLTITILPGWRREEIAEYLERLDLEEFSSTEFLSLTASLEGRLAPETYKIAPLSTAKTLVNILHQQFQKSVVDNPEISQQLATSNLALDEVLILASLLQREGKTAEEMSMIAGILKSRLNDNYPLQLCASAQYAVGKNEQTGKWWEPPTLADTKFDSPYNTYVVKGLPPAPICAVSLTAIKAALNPTPNDYYYYLHDPQGQIHYGKTLEEHQLNVQKYLR